MNRDTLIGVAGAVILTAAMAAVFVYESSNVPPVAGAQDGDGATGGAQAQTVFLSLTMRDPVPGAQSMSPAVLEAPVGATVVLNVTSDAGARLGHDLVIDEFNVRSKVLAPGETAQLTFVAVEAGDFPFHCSQGDGSHRTLGMQGTLKVS